MAKPKVESNMSGQQKVKMRTSVRDIKKPKVEPRDVFTIHQLKENAPEVEPLMDEDMMADEEEVEIRRVEPSDRYAPPLMPQMQVTPVEDDIGGEDIPGILEKEPKDTIRVKFGKFVQLVANRDFGDVINVHADDEIIMSSNLLTELAGTNDSREERKIPLVFLVGIVIGVVLTYIFFSQ